MDNTDGRHQGACLCGAVRFEIAGPLKQVIGCHCSLCRRQTGHFLAFTAAWNDTLRMISDETLRWFESSPGNRRGFCGTCGSMLFFASDGDDKTSITAGSLAGRTGLHMAAHIFAADKGDYYELEADVPAFDDGRDGVPMPPKP